MANVTRELRDRLGRIAEDAGDNLDRAGEVTSSKIYEVARLLHGHTVISYDDGKAVQEVLNRYVGEELQPKVDAYTEGMFEDADYLASVQKDIDYIGDLAKLFD